MTIKKFPQSCILVTSGKTKILIDPGMIDYDEKFLPEWKKADAILVSHRHGDHFNPEALAKIGKPIYSSAEVVLHNPTSKINIVKAGGKFKVGDITIEVTKAVHGFIPLMKTGAEILENIGFIMDDGKNRVYFTGDSMCFNNDYKADILVAPITSHGVTFTAFPLALYTKDVGAKLLVVVHQEKLLCPVDIGSEQKILKDNGINFVVPKVGEEISLAKV
ncbi:MAG: MBL fold metallo-hydrolase [Firmicutes bacterium]|nr:MBL fold metallo-hydrolase [Bacillota bacterium]